MYSEKLKELIEKKTRLKFRISSQQQSDEFQDFVFTVGVETKLNGFTRLRETAKDDYDLDDNYPAFLFLDYIVFPDKYRLSWEGKDREKYFNELEVPEFDLENDCLVEEKTKNDEECDSQEQATKKVLDDLDKVLQKWGYERDS